MKKLLSLIGATSLLALVLTSPTMAMGPYNSSEQNFAIMMIPHHQQAVLISQWELKQGANAAAKRLAARVIAEQGPEINQMKKWIPMGMAMDSGMQMQGMLSDADLAVMRKATGKKMDGLYLVNMTRHHLGAIDMATQMLSTKNSEVLALCQAIIKGQSAEVSEMNRIMRTGK
jgi:uncharacterized protein (DUF305 family)